MRLFEGTPFDRPPRCERCDQLLDECRCPPEAAPRVTPEQQTVRIIVERRKKGKIVTVVRGLSGSADEIAELLGQLKTICGAGGTHKESELEIQGSHSDRIRDVLKKLGYQVRTP